MLQQCRISELVGDKAPVVFTSTEEPVSAAMDKLRRSRVVSLPVLNKDRNVVGRLSVLDIAHNLLKYPTPEILSRFVGEVWRPAVFSQVSPVSGDFPISSLMEPFSRGVHHLLVEIEEQYIYQRNVSQSDLISYWFHNPSAVDLELRRKTLSELGIIKPIHHKITTATSLEDAIKLLVEERLNAVPVVDPLDGHLVTTLSISDFRNIDPEHISSMKQETIRKFLPPGVVRPITIKPEDTLEEAIKRMAVGKVHQLWVVDERDQPVGYVDQTSIIRAVYEATPQLRGTQQGQQEQVTGRAEQKGQEEAKQRQQGESQQASAATTQKMQEQQQRIHEQQQRAQQQQRTHEQQQQRPHEQQQQRPHEQQLRPQEQQQAKQEQHGQKSIAQQQQEWLEQEKQRKQQQQKQQGQQQQQQEHQKGQQQVQEQKGQQQVQEQQGQPQGQQKQGQSLQGQQQVQEQLGQKQSLDQKKEKQELEQPMAAGSVQH